MEVPLSRGQVALIDDADWELIKDYSWFAVKPHKVYYAVGHKPMINGIRKKIKMHRLIMNAPPGQQVDHINGNGLDNRRENLRLATKSQNQWNRHNACGTSKYKGVCWATSQGQWKASIRKFGKRVNLGFFDDEVDAARAYDAAAKELFGDFANLNIKEI